MGKKQVLGKGLSALLPSRSEPTPPPPPVEEKTATDISVKNTSNVSDEGLILEVSISEVIPNEFQPRRDFDTAALEDLARSIREKGILQPLVVRPTKNNKYELIAGERRWRASKLAGLETVPIIVRQATDRESLELALIENIQRENLNCVEESLSYFTLMEDFNLTHEELAQKVGKDRATITNSLRLLKLPETVLKDLREGTLSRGHGKVLLSLEDSQAKIEMAEKIRAHGWSVRETEKQIQGMGQSPKKTLFKNDPDGSRYQSVREVLEKKYNTKIKVQGRHKGKIVFEFYSKDHFNELYDKFVSHVQ